jgi:hypothetical protein
LPFEFPMAGLLSLAKSAAYYMWPLNWPSVRQCVNPNEVIEVTIERDGITENVSIQAKDKKDFDAIARFSVKTEKMLDHSKGRKSMMQETAVRVEHEIKQLVLKRRSAKSELEAQNHKADAEKKVRMLHMLKKQVSKYDSIEEQCMHDLIKAREELERIVFTRQYGETWRDIRASGLIDQSRVEQTLMETKDAHEDLEEVADFATRFQQKTQRTVDVSEEDLAQELKLIEDSIDAEQEHEMIASAPKPKAVYNIKPKAVKTPKQSNIVIEM